MEVKGIKLYPNCLIPQCGYLSLFPYNLIINHESIRTAKFPAQVESHKNLNVDYVINLDMGFVYKVKIWPIINQ